MTDTALQYDVVIIGGGVIGTAILWELARYDLSLALVEKRPDVCDTISKANSGIAHTGFDAPPGTLESVLVTRSNPRWEEICQTLQVPFRRPGAIMVALDEADLRNCEAVLEEARQNGVHSVRRMRADELLALEPHINPQVVGGLHIPGESITSSHLLPIAYAESAVLNGAHVYLEEPVTALRAHDTAIEVVTSRRTLRASWVVNAAGLYADEIARMVGDDSFTITPRKGEFFILDKTEGHLVQRVILPVPTPITKGILVSPTIDGNLLLGPTADDMQDKTDHSTTQDGLRRVAAGVQKLVPTLEPYRKTITQYAGLRSVCSTGRFEIRPSERAPRLIHAAGIRSTGLSASPELARYVRELLQEAGLALRPRPNYRPERPAIPLIRDATPEQAEALCRQDPRYGHLVCRCEHVSEAEIVQAIHAPVPARTVDAIKRRLRAGAGRCQGGFCGPRVMEILARELGIPLSEVRKDGAGSEIVLDKNKAAWR